MARIYKTLASAVLVVAVGAAPAAARPPSLTGEVFSQHVLYTGPVTGICAANTGTDYSFDFAGTAGGPYPGSFTEHIDVVIGSPIDEMPLGPFPDGFNPGSPNPSEFLQAAQLLSVNVRFAIDSPAGAVTGTKTLTAVVPADFQHAGVCAEFQGTPLPGVGNVSGAYKDVRHFDIPYQATITTGEGTFSDQGISALQGRQGKVTNDADDSVVSDVNDLGQSFDSTDDDADGLVDASDNCPAVSNPDQANLDGDSLGNPCDPDDDNDGVADASDACPTQANPTPTGCPAAKPRTLADLPPPELGEIVNVEELKGQVLVALAGSAAGGGRAHASAKLTYIPLSEARQIPIGSYLDTRKGTVRLQSAANKSGKRKNGDFSRGIFQVKQSKKKSAKGRTDLILKGGSFKNCGSAKKGDASAALSKKTIRKLKSKAKGRHKTSGKHSAATVRGTTWTVTDRCDGTLTKVQSGKVSVRDFRKKRTVTVKKGGRYLAKAPG